MQSDPTGQLFERSDEKISMQVGLDLPYVKISMTRWVWDEIFHYRREELMGGSGLS
jgi:hypothetical protein